MRATIYSGGETDARVIAARTAFGDGLTKLGVDWDHKNPRALLDTKPRIDDIAIIWGVSSKKFEHTAYRDYVRSRHHDTICIEVGFLNRDDYYSVGWGRPGEWPGYCCTNSPPDRWEKLGLRLGIPPAQGRYTLICGQIPHDTNVQDVDYDEWLYAECEGALKCTPVLFRNHPKRRDMPRLPKYVEVSERSLVDDLSEAHICVAWNSNALVDASLAGVHAIARGPRSMAWHIFPGRCLATSRQQWANDLAYCQWTLEEMCEGLPWLHLTQKRFGKR